MTASELFAGLSPEQAATVLGALRETNRPVFQSVTSVTASRRKLRPVFVDKKPLPERLAWVATELARKSNADVAVEVLQAWLFASRKPMLCGFLDELGVGHDGEGLIEDLPAEPPRAKLEAAVNHLLEQYGDWEVRVYLNLFCAMDIAAWPTLTEIVQNDPRLQSATAPV
jgi:hypothetical protein